jgi:hypothetical protein
MDIEDIAKVSRMELRANALQYCSDRRAYRVMNDFRNPCNHDWALAILYEHEAKRLRRHVQNMQYKGAWMR